MINTVNVVYVFMDASNLWQAQKAKGRFLDLGRTIGYVKDETGGTSIKVFYYTAYPATGTRVYSLDRKHKFYFFLSKALGFVVRKKKLKRIVTIDGSEKVVQEKGNMDVEMTIDAICLCKEFDAAVLFSGDSDFLALVNYLKKLGKNVYIFSSKNNVSQELRTGTDGYTDILKIDSNIWGREIIRREDLSK